MFEGKKKEPKIQGDKWRKLDNTGKLFAAVAGEDLSNVFRLSAVLKEEIQPEPLLRALEQTLEEYENFRVKQRKGFFWDYFETNDKDPLVELEEGVPCKYIDPHENRKFPFRVSYYKNRINLEVFHGLTDGLGALNFMKAMTEHYLERVLNTSPDSGWDEEQGACGKNGEKSREKVPEKASGKSSAKAEASSAEQEKRTTDGYLKNYKKQPSRRYSSRKALPVKGARMPLNGQSVIHASLPIRELKAQSRKYGISLTKYLAAAMIWSLIHIYNKGETLKYPAALNLPVNLRAIFDTETMANFFAITNVYWPAGPLPERFEDVITLVDQQMNEQMTKEYLEEKISYNVSTEKKWYLRIIPRAVKRVAMDLVFRKTSQSHTMTFTNVGPVKLKPEYTEHVEKFHALLGVSDRQRMKCCVIAYGDYVDLTITSVMTDSRLQDYFFGFLEKQGIHAELESNGAVRPDLDQGNYPQFEYDPGKLKRFSRLFYLVLFTTAALTGVINLATYRLMPYWWSVISIAVAGYVAMILRYSIMRKASLAGHLVRHSLGIQALIIALDVMTGFDGWSVDYVIPGIILFDIIAVVFLILVNRMNWQSYFMYQIALTVFSFIPLLLWWIGLVKRPLLSLIAVVLAVSVLAVTILLGDRGVKDELRRRFHL